ncbi:helix-turn-helix domain-containing protein [Micromonospora sp. NPDC093243]|uniref:helix-turn-helix domain-containing protein n=1 Tax=Micromonospora sp. NPDC093243 TaxID=3364290 RepID=UPI0038042257
MSRIPTLTFLHEQLRRARQARGLSQEELGKRVNYSSSYVSAVETGQSPVKPDYLAVRDSKDPAGPALTFPPASWRAFVAATPTSH